VDNGQRDAFYTRQNGSQRLTPRQRRRLFRKFRIMLKRQQTRAG
jgi:hypothetical protein